MGYLEKNLQKDEKVEMVVEMSSKWWIEVVIGFCIIIGIPAAINTIIKRYTLEQMITNQRVIQKKGLISRNIEEMRLSKIETVEYTQGILGRILGFGSVKVTGTLSKLELVFVDNPKDIKHKIDSLLN